MLIRKLFVIIIFLSAHPITSFADDNGRGYNEICRIYTEAYNTNMPVSTLSQYIFENIKKRVQSKDATEAHDSVIHADAATRYELFKISAEHTLNRTWDCKSMSHIMEMRVEQN